MKSDTAKQGKQILMHMGGLKSIFIAVIMLIWAWGGIPVLAGETLPERGVSTKDRPTDYRPNLPEFNASEPETKLELPPASIPEQDKQRDVTSPKVFIKKFQFQGNHVISTEELEKITASYENREITFEELNVLRNQLTTYYIDKGYINSGVILPDQDIVDGMIVFQVIEGKLSDIQITGNDRLRKEYIFQRIDMGKEDVLNVYTLQEKLQLLQQNPLIQYIKGEIVPGAKPGEAVLKVDVREARPYHAGLQVNNHQSPSTGAEILEGYASHDNLTTFGDRLEIHYGLAQGTDDGSGSYVIPLNAADTAFGLSYDRTSSTVIEEPFEELDIDSLTDTFAVSLSQPFYKTINQEFVVTLSGEKRYDKTTLLGQPFSFSEGINNGRYKETVIRLEQNWVMRSRINVVAVRSVFSLGIDALDATVNSSGPDGEFFTWIGQLQWGYRLERLHDSQIIFRTDTQLAANPLLPMERIAIGGASTVRGYRENQLLRDNGIISSLEMRIPVFRISVPKITKNAEEGILNIAPFADIGHGWNKDAPQGDLNTLASLGLGLRWDPGKWIHTEIYWGVPLREPENKDHHDLQDYGIHFLMNWQFF